MSGRCAIFATDPLYRAGNGHPLARDIAVPEFDMLDTELPGPFECLECRPERAGNPGFKHGRRAGRHDPLGELPGPIKPRHEERQPPLPHPLQSGEAVGKLFKTDTKPALQQGQVITACFARPQQPAIGHDQCRREIAGQMPAKQPQSRAVSKSGTIGQGVDRLALFKQGQLDSNLESPRCRIKLFRQLQLAGMKVNPPKLVGHYFQGQYPDRQLMTAAQPLDQGGSDVGV